MKFSIFQWSFKQIGLHFDYFPSNYQGKSSFRALPHFSWSDDNVQFYLVSADGTKHLEHAPSGSGKTMSALLQASGITDYSKIAVIDTENHSVGLYAHLGVVKDYCSDESFCRNDLGNINLWKLFNFFTGANIMSYIDTYLDRGVGCQQFIQGFYQAIGENKHHWFIS